MELPHGLPFLKPMDHIASNLDQTLINRILDTTPTLHNLL